MSVKDGKILSPGKTGMVYQILPHVNKWAWDLYLTGMANHWNPSDIPMAKDIEQWRDPLVISEDEKLLYKRCMGFFAGTESLVANNLFFNLFRYVRDPEVAQYACVQLKEEMVHNHTIVYVCDSLGLDIAEVYEAHANVPSIKAKDDFLMRVTENLASGPPLDLSITENKQKVLKNIIIYYMVCEGIFFYSGFAMLLSFGRQGKMPGTCEQINYTLKDESLHLTFGTRLINEIVSQEPDVWTPSFKREVLEMVKEATDLEIRYARDVLPRGVLGLNAELFIGYSQYIGKRRLEGVGLASPWKNPKNPFPWLAETIDLAKMKNFFETRVTEYATGLFTDDL